MRCGARHTGTLGLLLLPLWTPGPRGPRGCWLSRACAPPSACCVQAQLGGGCVCFCVCIRFPRAGLPLGPLIALALARPAQN